MNDSPIIMASGKYLRLIRRGHWEYAERTGSIGAVTIVAVTPEQELLLVEQYRIPLSAGVIELPAGLSGDIAGEEHEALAAAARRELLEETGYEAAEMHWLTTGPTSAGLANEVVSFFLARGLIRVHDGGGDANENITVHRVPLASADDWLAAHAAEGRQIDPKIYAGLYFLQRQK